MEDIIVVDLCPDLKREELPSCEADVGCSELPRERNGLARGGIVSLGVRVFANILLDSCASLCFHVSGEKTCRCGMIFEKQPELQVVEECCSLASKINNADKLVSLYYLPDCLKHRLSQLLCDSQRMNAHVFKLLLQGSPTEVCVKDCSWLTEEEFTKCLQNFDPSNLMAYSLPGLSRLDHVPWELAKARIEAFQTYQVANELSPSPQMEGFTSPLHLDVLEMTSLFSLLVLNVKNQGKWKKGKNKRPKKAKSPIQKPKGKCFHCNGEGHWKRNCHKYLEELKKKKEQGKSDLLVLETCLVEGDTSAWIIDSGATNHVYFSLQSLSSYTELADGDYTMKVGNGARVSAKAVGEVLSISLNYTGSSARWTLSGVEALHRKWEKISGFSKRNSPCMTKWDF
ncbi:hypothetical protein L484_021752 [Morus notabilis]|uniref:CCHC-type domain-containing protein n=1 Tax=Morus notabilis TaxID=981085 RepID=W9S4E7_9ROSA|nr:hypothetical protein L484_021752 [Morus notabilis]